MLSKRFFKTKNEVEVVFQIDRDGIEHAAVVCEATGWQPIPMKRAGRGKGPFRAKLRLPKGKAFEFRYLFNGDWWDNDEAADDYWPNEHGSHNSVVTTIAEPVRP